MPRIGELIKSGRAFVAEEWGLIVMAVLGVPAIVTIVSSVLQKLLGDSPLSFVVSIASAAVSLLVTLGSIHITLALVDGRATSISELFSRSNLFWRFLWASILYGFAIVIGFILLIVPGVYMALKYGFYGYVIVDRPEFSAIDALKESARLTDGIKWKLFSFYLALIGINVLGALALGIGLLYTIPVSSMATVALYRSLTRIAGRSVEPAVPSVEPVVPVSTETPSLS